MVGAGRPVAWNAWAGTFNAIGYAQPFGGASLGSLSYDYNYARKPAAIIEQLQLLRPIYRKTTNYGHFGREDDLDALRWERTDRADALKQFVS